MNGDQARAALRTMWRIRVFEERVGRLKRADQVPGLIHLSIGGEGVAAAVCGQLSDDDVAYSGHRAHGHVIAKGAPLRETMAELMGRARGLCRGMGGSMHLVDAAHGMLGATGVVGGSVPLALGSALAARMLGKDAVAVVFFGDGAVQSGVFAESVNLAALWRLPVVLVCENNGFAEFTPRSAHTPVERVSDLVATWGVTSATVDGSEAPAVWDAFGELLDGARAGRGPALLEALTHRLRGHYEGDPDRYRDAVSSEEWRRLDPIVRLEETGVERGWFDAGEAKSAREDAVAAVDDAVEWAGQSPYPTQALAAASVYAS
ncbi:thiamine pyrophosphate-dependent dehydrogenase E1 component subunit alpha [Actinomadura welshii]|uniref:thiamine pyrophosphate-dependent dehydrogenase E1 component subunit alpha n=1 Tax=Actinomadura welshii TaxID=3103817 RepID=UPI0003AD5C02|nr:thiamine pyrophosphate-dependent dehydrogenase E1 component subunit alpha [Actinomadura madurae]